MGSRDDAALQNQGHGFGAAGHPQFGQDVADVGFDGGGADDQTPGDLSIVQALDYQGENFTLAFGQVQAGGWRLVVGFDQALRGLGRERSTSGVGRRGWRGPARWR